MKIAAYAVLMSAFIAGCAAPPPVKMQTRFVGSDHDQYRQQGSGAIVGQGFLRQQGGGVVTCAGREVYLFPGSPFFTEYFGHVLAGRRVDPNSMGMADPAYREVAKKTECDAQGNFTFSGLTSGSWFVMTEVKWVVGNSPEGGTLMRLVSLSDGQTGKLALSNNDLVGW